MARIHPQSQAAPRLKLFRHRQNGRSSPDPAAREGGLLINRFPSLLRESSGKLKLARKEVNKRIRKELEKITPPFLEAIPMTPHAYLGHRYLPAALNIGETDYRNISSFNLVCVNRLGVECGHVHVFKHLALAEKKIFSHPVLTPLLLARNEIKVYHKESTDVPPVVPITRSRQFPRAVDRFYAEIPTLDSLASEQDDENDPASDNNAGTSASTVSSMTPPAYIFPRDVGKGSSQRQRIAPSRPGGTRSAGPGEDHEVRKDKGAMYTSKPNKNVMHVIDLTSSASEDEQRGPDEQADIVPLLLVFCPGNSVELKAHFAFGEAGVDFSLLTFYDELLAKGVKLSKKWEILLPSGQWKSWDVGERIAKHTFEDDSLQTFFFRVSGMNTDQFTPYHSLSSLAFPFKGKGRVA